MAVPPRVSALRPVAYGRRRRSPRRYLLIACLVLAAIAGVWELWKHSSMPPRWEDRLHGDWTGHSAVQSLALSADGGVVAGGFAPRMLEPEARVVSYDRATGLKRWQWHAPLIMEGHRANQVRLESLPQGIAVTIGVGLGIGFVPLKSWCLNERTGESVDEKEETVVPSPGKSSSESQRLQGSIQFPLAGPAEYSARAVAVNDRRPVFLRWIDRLLRRSQGNQSSRFELIVERQPSPESGDGWTWRAKLAAMPKQDGVVLAIGPEESVRVAFPRQAYGRTAEYDVIRLDAKTGGERPLPGTVIRAARLPSGVRPLALICAPDGQVIAGGRAENARGDGWWIAAW